MRYYLICEEEDTKTGMRLAGIGGTIVRTPKEMEQCIQEVCADESIAVMLVTEPCAQLMPEKISEMRLSAHRPLVVIIPESGSTGKRSDSMLDLIREAIGIRI